MIKTIFKEVIIILLLCLAILLVLSVLFYDYNPINKVVPNKIAYTTPEEIKSELEEENTIQEITVENKVYTIEGSDLNIYKKSNSYIPGKANPFATTTMDTNIVDDGSGNESKDQTEIKQETGTNVDTKNKDNTAATSTNTTFWNTNGSK